MEKKRQPRLRPISYAALTRVARNVLMIYLESVRVRDHRVKPITDSEAEIVRRALKDLHQLEKDEVTRGTGDNPLADVPTEVLQQRIEELEASSASRLPENGGRLGM